MLLVALAIPPNSGTRRIRTIRPIQLLRPVDKLAPTIRTGPVACNETAAARCRRTISAGREVLTQLARRTVLVLLEPLRNFAIAIRLQVVGRGRFAIETARRLR